MYSIIENLITSKNRPHLALRPVGLVYHATATPGAGDEAEREYFQSHDVESSAHYFVDWDSITRIVPEDEVAWHAGAYGNNCLSMELCEPKGHDPEKFEQVWRRGVWLGRDICQRRGFDAGQVLSHDYISRVFGGTDHSDPVAFFAQYGRTCEQFVAEMFQPTTITIQEVKMFEKLITGNFSGDGKEELAAFYRYDGNRVGLLLFELLPDGHFICRRVWLSNPGDWDYDRMKVEAADIDACGRHEICVAYDYGQANTGINVFDAKKKWQPEQRYISGEGNFDWQRI